MNKLTILFLLLLLVIGCQKDASETVPKVQSIAFDKVDPIIFIGDSLQLNVTHSPSNANRPTYEWASDNPEIVSVNSLGKLYGKAIGSATVTVKTTNGGISSQTKVTVLPVSSSGVTLNKTSINLLVGSSEGLLYTINPYNATNKGVTWSSLDSKIATVDAAGLVTAVAIGETSIQVVSKDGKSKALCTVTISPILISAITITNPNLSLTVNQEYKLIANILPVNASDKTLIWSSSNPVVAKVSTTGTVNAVSKGNTIISAKSTDGKVIGSSNVTVIDEVKYSREVFNKLKADLLDPFITYNEVRGNNLGMSLNSTHVFYTVEAASVLGTHRLSSAQEPATFNFLKIPDGNVLRITSNYTYKLVPNSTVDGFMWMTIDFLETTWQVTTTFGFITTFKYTDNIQLAQLNILVDENIARQRKYILTGTIR